MIKHVLVLIFGVIFSFSAFAGNLYETLGVSNEASHEEIKSAWKALVRKNHPDRFMGDPEAVKAATETLAVINAAENVIGNKTLRAYYDHLSNKGLNHNRWASIPGNSNEDSLKKMFGPVDLLKKTPPKNPFAGPQAKPAPSATPRATPSPSPKPTAEPKKDSNASIQDPIFEFFRMNTATEEKWREMYRHYIVETPNETEAARQMILLKLLTVPMEDWKFEALARAVILKFDNIDPSMGTTLKNILSSQDPKVRKIAVTLVHYAIVKERTLDLFKMDRTQAESYLVERLNDVAPLVQERSKAAIEKLGVAVQENFTAMMDIQLLNSNEAKIRESAFKRLLNIKDFNDSELKLLAQELLKRNIQFNRYFWPHLPQEMSAILEIFNAAKNLSVIAEELRSFRATTFSPQHRLSSRQLEERAFSQKTSSAIRCEAVFK